ncbi:MAG: hypothetical protein ACLFTW_02015 [Chitinispirillaceae bacterium]
MKIRKLLWPLLVLLAFCSDPSNPFTDYSNATVHIMETSFSVDAGLMDTVPIFSTQRFVLATTVQQLLDSFTVSAGGNRFFTDTTIHSPGTEQYVFRLSFYDTGVQRVTVKAYRSNGDHTTRDIRVYAVNPLHQQDLPSAEYSSSVILSTPEVGDEEGIIYNWSFGGEGYTTVRSFASACTSVVSNANIIDKVGKLWVTDGSKSSPSVPFSFFFYDTAPPVIQCLNDLYDPELKTITTPDTFFTLRLRVTDRGNQPVEAVEFNGEKVDPSSFNIYTKFVGNMHNHAENPLRIAVRAVDKYELMNEVRDTFKVLFDPTAVIKDSTSLEITSISGDTVSSIRNSFTIFGTVDNTAGRSMVLKAQLNDQEFDDTLISGGRGVWSWNFQLSDGLNTFKVDALDSAGTVQNSKAVTIYFDPRSPDTVPPVIYSVYVDDVNVSALQGKNVYVSERTADIKVIAFDEGSGVSSVSLNGTVLENAVSNYEWHYTMEELVPKVNEAVVSASDGSGNMTEDTIKITYNRKPEIANSLSLPYVIEIGKTYLDTIMTFDADGDLVTILENDVPEGMEIDDNGCMKWTPDETHKGEDTLEIQLWDECQWTEQITWTFMVVDSATLKPEVEFPEIKIPSYLESGKDTLQLKLGVKEGTGQAPFRYSARIIGPDTTLLRDTLFNEVTWAPQTQDTGIVYVRLNVSDNLQDTDTLYHSFQVVPENKHTCELNPVIPAEFKTADGGIDLRRTTEPVSIKIKIEDKDHILTERYAVGVETAEKTTEFEADSMSFDLKITPTLVRASDTIRISVVDNTMRPYPEKSASLKIPVLFMFEENPFDTLIHSVYDPLSIQASPSGEHVEGWASSDERFNLVAGSVYNSFSRVYLRPTLLREALNGYDVSRFRNNDYLYSASENSGAWIDSTFTIFVVAMCSGLQEPFMTLVASTEESGGGAAFGLTPDGKMSIVDDEIDFSSPISSSSLQAEVGKWYVFSYRSDGIVNHDWTVDMRMSGAQENGVTLTSVSARNDLYVGSCSGSYGKYHWRGDMAEILYYKGQLSDSDWGDVERYLMQKYGLQ